MLARLAQLARPARLARLARLSPVALGPPVQVPSPLLAPPPESGQEPEQGLPTRFGASTATRRLQPCPAWLQAPRLSVAEAESSATAWVAAAGVTHRAPFLVERSREPVGPLQAETRKPEGQGAPRARLAPEVPALPPVLYLNRQEYSAQAPP